MCTNWYKQDKSGNIRIAVEITASDIAAMQRWRDTLKCVNYNDPFGFVSLRLCMPKVVYDNECKVIDGILDFHNSHRNSIVFDW